MATIPRADQPIPVALPTRLARPLLCAAGVLAGFVLVAVVDPHLGGRYPLCPWLALTGTYCPACGGLRAANELAHGDVSAALSSNALLVLGLPVLAACWLGWLTRRARGGVHARAAFPQPSPGLTAALALLVLAFALVRNTPAGAVLAP